MWPSRWAEIIAQVAEITGETATTIKRQMPIAQCYQYQQMWFAKNDCWPMRPDLDADEVAASSYLG